MRRVVTGQDAAGQSIFVSDTVLPHRSRTGRTGGWNVDVWGADEHVRLPSDGSPHHYETAFPPPGGFRSMIVSMAPDPPLEERRVTDAAKASASKGTARAVYDVDGSGMHTTETIDIAYVVDGEVDLELDDGVEVHLEAGDVVVQNGTRHAWHNRSDRDCLISFTIVGAAEPD